MPWGTRSNCNWTIGGKMRAPLIRARATWYGLLFAIGLILVVFSCMALRPDKTSEKGYRITETGLYPVYPSGYSCSPLTSLYASYLDVDGTRRDQPHSGVDGGRLGDVILAPADGTVKAAWRANWGWGPEGALIIRHSREDLKLQDGPPFYYSEFDHLRYQDAMQFKVGQRVARGDKIGIVDRPGGKRKYLPEVHWEVHEITDDAAMKWSVGKYGTQVWTNETSELIDPLYLLSRNSAPSSRNGVTIVPFEESADYSQFRGFTYILPCRREDG